jgi:hypothetical protein
MAGCLGEGESRNTLSPLLQLERVSQTITPPRCRGPLWEDPQVGGRQTGTRELGTGDRQVWKLKGRGKEASRVAGCAVQVHPGYEGTPVKVTR